LHGSANVIGGLNTVVKFKYGHPVEDFPIPDAPPGIKFALGENPKRVGSTPGRPVRYPITRMGEMETIRDAFLRARDYRQSWVDYRAKAAKKTTKPPFSRAEIWSSNRSSKLSKASVSFIRTVIVRTSI
jgi:hypothetical protein